jgi:hypothetical protein
MVHEHQSGLLLGAIMKLNRHGKPQWAQLHCIIPNGEEWRIYQDQAQRRYLYSAGWLYVKEHQTNQDVA